MRQLTYRLVPDSHEHLGTCSMTNLYSRLVGGEDQRTEALADLLDRILADDRERDTRRFGDFMSRVLLADATVEPAKADLLGRINDPAAVLSVATQHRIGHGSIPDMLLFDGNDPLCVVEVKIDAALGKNQLEGYGRWLEKRANHGYKPALVLLTHVTSAPPGFTDRGNESFGVELRSIAFWNTVAEWFAELGVEEDGVGEPLKSLSAEFGEFLKEEAMPTLDDVAIARNYFAHSHTKLTRAVENMQAGYEFPGHWGAGNRLYTEPVGIWKYRYPEGAHGDRYVYVGFCFKPTDENDDTLHGYARYENGSIDDPERVVISDGFYAFVCSTAPEEDCRLVPGFNENRWYEHQDGNLVQANDGPPLDSTGWWHYSDEDDDWAGYARISPLQELLDGDGRPRQRAEELDTRRFGQDRVPVERCLRTGWIIRGNESHHRGDFGRTQLDADLGSASSGSALPATDGRMWLAYSTTHSKPCARGRCEAQARTEPG